MLETLHAARDGELLRAAAGELRDLLAPHAEQVTVRLIGPQQPYVEL